MWRYPVDEAIRRTKKLGFEGLEVWVDHIWYYNTPLDKIIEAKNTSNIKLTLHSPNWDTNLCALNNDVRKISLWEHKKAIQIADTIGARNLTLHPGKLTLPTLKKWHFQKSIESIRTLVKFADSHNVTISIELMESLNKEFINTPSIMNRLLSQLPDSVKVTFDVAHLDNNDDFDIYISSLNNINKFHISNRCRKKLHVPCSEGYLDCERFIKSLIHMKHPLIIEGFDDSKNNEVIKKNISFLDKIDFCL